MRRRRPTEIEMIRHMVGQRALMLPNPAADPSSYYNISIPYKIRLE